jgi:hypothetical protein
VTTDFRVLCAGLLKGLDENRHPEVRYPGDLRILMAEARALLAEPVGPVGEGAAMPTPADLIAFIRSQSPWKEWMRPDGCLASAHFELAELLRSALSRYASPPAPVAVGERLPPDGELAWYFDAMNGDRWELFKPCPSANDTYTHWLPHHAIPIPDAT